MAKTLDCDFKVSDVELQVFSYVHFWTNILVKGMKPLILQAIGYIVS